MTSRTPLLLNPRNILPIAPTNQILHHTPRNHPKRLTTFPKWVNHDDDRGAETPGDADDDPGGESADGEDCAGEEDGEGD